MPNPKETRRGGPIRFPCQEAPIEMGYPYPETGRERTYRPSGICVPGTRLLMALSEFAAAVELGFMQLRLGE